MASGARLVEEWPDRAAEDPTPAATAQAEPGAIKDNFEQPRRWPELLTAVLLAIAAAAWIGIAAWRAWLAFAAGRPGLADVVAGTATASAPLALAGVGYLLLRRTSRRESRRFARTSAAMQTQAESLELVLATLSTRIEENRRALGDHAHQLLLLGDDAAVRLAGISGKMRAETGELARQSDILERAAADARVDMGVLLQDLPRATAESRDMAALLKQAGLGAHEQAAALEATLAALSQRGRDAEEVAGGAAQRLAAHLARIEGASGLAGDRLEAAASQMTGAVDVALAAAARAVDEARQAIETQSAAMLAMVEQGRVALERAGADSARTLSERLDGLDARLERMAAQLAGHDAAGGALIARLDGGLTGIERRFETLADSGQEHTAALTQAVDTLGAHAEVVDARLGHGAEAAEALVARAEALVGLLRQGGTELAESLPPALDALEQRVADNHAALVALVPEAAKLAESAAEMAGTLGDADALLARQGEAIRSLGAAAEERLAAIQDHADRLGATLSGSGEQAQRLVDMAAPQLIDALLRVRETAVQAADRAREAIAAVIPEAARSLGDAAQAALAGALDASVRAQMAEVASAGEQAVEATNRATERLMHQMLTIADTTAMIEARIAEAKAETEQSDEESLSRRVALLIEALNSTSINVATMLSQEVSDGAWGGYLRGDRGIFTRRVVRLLDSTQAREVQRLYLGNAEFRDQLNRYIHDFEAMLRRVLASRDGSPLGITLLSSDMGKLYVALAQAIERLRS